MLKFATIEIEIDEDLKKAAETVLKKHGYTPSGAVDALYSDIARCGMLPFDPCCRKPLCDCGVSADALQKAIDKGMAIYKKGKTYSKEEVDELLELKYEQWERRFYEL